MTDMQLCNTLARPLPFIQIRVITAVVGQLDRRDTNYDFGRAFNSAHQSITAMFPLTPLQHGPVVMMHCWNVVGMSKCVSSPIS